MNIDTNFKKELDTTNLKWACERVMCSKPSDLQKLIDKYELEDDFPKELIGELKELVKRSWY